MTRRIGHVSERAVRYRIERLVRAGVIKVTAIVNPQAVGYRVTGDVIIEVAPGMLQTVAEQLCGLDNISYVAGSVGDGDLSAQVYARDTEDLLRFVDEVIGKVQGSLAYADRHGPLEAQGHLSVAHSRDRRGEGRRRGLTRQASVLCWTAGSRVSSMNSRAVVEGIQGGDSV